MENQKTYERRKTHANNLIDLQGQASGEVILRVGGHKLEDLRKGWIENQHRGKPNATETKQSVIQKFLQEASPYKINELLQYLSAENLVHLFLNFDEYKEIAELAEEQLDSDPHNKVALAKEILERVVKPFGLTFEVKNSLVGLNINIGVEGHSFPNHFQIN